MWILWKIRFWKCEFCEKWYFQNVNFGINWGFLPQCVCPGNGQSLNCHISVSVEKWLRFTIYGENWHKLPPGKCTIISTLALICSAMYALEKGVGVLRASKFQLSFACMHDLSYWFLNGFGCSQSPYINLI